MNKVIKLLLLLIPSFCFAQNYGVDWHVIGSGGGGSHSANYRIEGTLGQPIVGISNSANYAVEAGFWVGAIGLKCEYIPGDINGSGAANGIDVTYGVTYLKGGIAPPDSCECPDLVYPFYAAMDVNGSCSANGIDITYFVSYLKGIQSEILFCNDCPPARITETAARVGMPVGTRPSRQSSAINSQE